MGTAKTIAKNTGFLFASEILRKILFFFVLIYATRILGKVEFGRFSFAIAYTSVFPIIIDLGLSFIVIRDISRDKRLVNKYVANIFLMRLVMAFISFVFIVTSINALGYSTETKYVVYIAGVVVFLDSLSDFFKFIFQAFERMEYVAYSRLLQASVVFLIGLYVLLSGKGLHWFILSYLIASIINFIYTLSTPRKKFCKINLEVDLNLWKKLISSGAPIFLSNIFVIIYSRADTILLSYIKGEAVVGIYSAAYQLISAVVVIPTLFATAVFPVLSRLYKTSKDTLIVTYKKSLKYMLIIGLPIAVGALILADKIIMLLYSQEYYQSTPVLKILAFFGLSLFVNYILNNVLISIDRQKDWMKISGVSAAFNVVLNVYLINKMGYIGAAIATLITQVLVFILSYHYLTRYLPGINLARLFLKPLIAAALMGTFTYIFRDSNLFLIVPSSAVLYFSLLWIMKEFTEDDKMMLKSITSTLQNRFYPIKSLE